MIKTTYSRLTDAEEDVFRRLEAGEHVRDIATSFKTTERHFRRWLRATPDRAARADAVRSSVRALAPRNESISGALSRLTQNSLEVFERIESGEPIRSIAVTFEVSPRTLYRWLSRDPLRLQRFREARQVAAHVLAEEAIEIADAAELPADVPAAKLQVDARRWLAARLNPESYGMKAEHKVSGTVGLDIAALHLDALRRRGGPSSLPNAAPGPPEPGVAQTAPREALEASGSVPGTLTQVQEAQVLGELPAGLSESEMDELQSML